MTDATPGPFVRSACAFRRASHSARAGGDVWGRGPAGRSPTRVRGPSGNIMRGCTARDVPCHRVIAAGGRLGGYGGYQSLKAALLRAEGVRVVGSRIREFQRIRWAG